MLIFGKTKEEKFYRIASEKYSSEACTRILLHWSPALCQCAGFFKSLTKRTLSRLCVFFFVCIFQNFAVRPFLRNTSYNSKSLQKVLVLIKYWAKALLQILISNESYLQTLLFINHNNKSISFSLENIRCITCSS